MEETPTPTPTTVDGPAPGRVPTWHARSGRLTPTKRAALDRLAATWGPPPTLRAPSHVALEIGAGSGEAAIALALSRPGLHVVGAEVHAATLASFALRAEATGRDALANLSIVRGDGRDVLDTIPGTVVVVRAFFPDPWPKHRHRRRRLVDAAFAQSVATRLAPGGVMELATDDASYAAAMAAVLGTTVGLVGGVAERADRPITHYERLAAAAGRTVVDLRYERVRTGP
ncbi:MAG: tRNA (guanosine(46)-N7)-methyltransferase TrmB [Actinobacteria bacterium]|nr:tRNA (guanosine(46)-N7)-methyltransferase TrmB [Actinomycetota bacterium]